MTSALNFLWLFIRDLWVTIDTVSFDIFNTQVSLGALLLGFICMSMIISFFWKGARG